MLTAAIESAADICCPRIKITVKKQHSKWVDKNIREHIVKRNNWHKLYLFNHDQPNWRQGYAEYCYNQFKKERNLVKTLLSKTKSEYYANEVNNIKNSKNAWRKLDELSGRNPLFAEPITILKKNVTINQPQEIANEFAEFFPNKIQKIKDTLKTSTYPLHTSFSVNDFYRGEVKFKFLPVTEIEIINHIKTLSSSTATGHDFISNKLLKDVKYLISKPLSKIINNAIRRESFPESWKLGKICALYKKKGITLLCSLSKIFEKILHSQILNYFDLYNLFDPRQYGFRQGYSCELAVADLVNTILMAKENANSSKINGLLFDLSAAFDIVEHEKLLGKLKSYGFKNSALNLLSSYLSNRYSYVEVETKKSKNFHLKFGVPQGSILGPLLYLIYIGSITQIDDFMRIIYADDTNCVVTGKNNEELENRTNEAFSNVVHYYESSGLKLNQNKTQTTIKLK